MLQFRPEFAGIGDLSFSRRPKRTEIPIVSLIGRWSRRWRDFPASQAHSDVLDGNHIRKSSKRASRKQAEFILNDQTLGTFLGNLRITLPQWRSRSLADELQAYEKEREKKK